MGANVWRRTNLRPIHSRLLVNLKLRPYLLGLSHLHPNILLLLLRLFLGRLYGLLLLILILLLNFILASRIQPRQLPRRLMFDGFVIRPRQRRLVIRGILLHFHECIFPALDILLVGEYFIETNFCFAFTRFDGPHGPPNNLMG
jgi:hypothetical protein